MGELTWVDMEATGMKFLEYPYFAFSVYTCMIWIAWWGLRYVFRVLPEVLIRMADLVNAWTVNEPGFTEKFAFYVDYIRHLKTYLTILIVKNQKLCDTSSHQFNVSFSLLMNIVVHRGSRALERHIH